MIRKLAGDTVVYGLAGTINRSMMVLLIPVYTRFFSAGDYGALGVALSFFSLAHLLLTAMDNAAGRWFFDPDRGDHRKEVIASWLWFQVAAGALILAAAAVLARPLAGQFFHSPDFAALIVLACLAACVSPFGKVLGAWLRFTRRPWLLLGYSVGSSVGTVGIIVLFVAVWNLGVAGTFLAQALAGIGTALLAAAVLRTWIHPGRFSPSVFGEMFRFSLPVFPATVAAWAVLVSDRFIMPFFMPASEIGIYFLAFQVASVIGLADAAFQMAWGPFALSMMNHPDSKATYSRVLGLYTFFGSWGCLILSLLAPVVLPVVATPAYGSAASCIPMLSFFFLLIGMANITGIGAMIVKDSRPVAMNLYIGAAAGTALLFALLPVLGKEGAALAKLAGMTAAFAFVYAASQRLCPIPYSLRDLALCFASAWLLIGLAQLLSGRGYDGIAVRLALSLVFIPVGFGLGFLRPDCFKNSILLVRDRLLNLAS